MTLLLTGLTMVAFAGVYAVLLAMIGNNLPALLRALQGDRPAAQGLGGRPATPAASRRFNRA